MQEPVKDRRRTSFSGLLDSAIRGVSKLTAANDPTTKSLANQVLKDLLQLRREIPARREYDMKTRLP